MSSFVIVDVAKQTLLSGHVFEFVGRPILTLSILAGGYDLNLNNNYVSLQVSADLSLRTINVEEVQTLLKCTHHANSTHMDSLI